MSRKIFPCVIGLGYVGLPVFIRLNRKYQTIGFDIDKTRINSLKKRNDFNNELSSNDLKLYKKFIDYVVIGVLNLNQLKEINTSLKKKIIKNNIKFKKVPIQLYDPRKW